MDIQQLIISPKTKVLQLIEAYPQLEDVLINYVPAFKKLKNPVLRNTVAKIATLQQAAGVGNVKVEDLINTLRKEVGQDAIESIDDVKYNTKQPEWFESAQIKTEIDIREMLNSGQHPVNEIIADLKKLQPNEIFKIIVPFVPAPLLDKALSLEIEHWVKKEDDELYSVYFSPAKK